MEGLRNIKGFLKFRVASEDNKRFINSEKETIVMKIFAILLLFSFCVCSER